MVCRFLLSIGYGLVRRLSCAVVSAVLWCWLWQRCPMGSIIKTVTYYERAWWREKGYSGSLLCDRWVRRHQHCWLPLWCTPCGSRAIECWRWCRLLVHLVAVASLVTHALNGGGCCGVYVLLNGGGGVNCCCPAFDGPRLRSHRCTLGSWEVMTGALNAACRCCSEARCRTPSTTAKRMDLCQP